MALFRRLWRTKGSLLSLAVLMTLFWILFLSGPSLPGQTSEQQVVNSNVPASEGPARQDLNSFGEELDSPRPEDSVVPQMDPSLAVRPGSGGIVQQASPLHGRLALELKRSLRQVEDFKDKVKAQHLEQTRVKATFIALARNSELTPMLHTMAQIEATFNKEYRYPYLFLNDEEFSEEFKRKITASTKAPVQFAIVPKEHWSVPSFISTEKLRQRLKQMEADSIPYGGLESYRHMCRFYSGFFYKHPALLDFDYYWRIEPDVDYVCKLDYDPFLFMKVAKKKYGYNIVAPEFMKTVDGLWDAAKTVVQKQQQTRPNPLKPEFAVFGDDKTYNGLHFWSNFEIGDLNWFRSKEYEDFFKTLDATGGFFYERWGDAPVHAIATGVLLDASEVHYFGDIGYRHMDRLTCPSGGPQPVLSQCSCNLNREVDRRNWVYRDHWGLAFVEFFDRLDKVRNAGSGTKS